MADKENFAARYGPWAIVAGASEGLGAAYAEELAARGLNLILIARRPEVLQSSPPGYLKIIASRSKPLPWIYLPPMPQSKFSARQTV
jgi:uncharacterized protein